MRCRSISSRGLLAGTVVSAALAATACGSSESDKTPAQILQDASAAVQSVHTYHLSGSGTSSGGQTTFDLRIAPNGLAGSLSTGPTKADMAYVNGRLYLRGKQFFEQFGGPAAAEFVDDNWVKLPSSSSSSFTSAFTGFADTKKLGNCLTSGTSGLSFTKSTATVNGQSVVVLHSSALTINVATSGPAYPVQVTESGSAPSFDNCISGSTSSSTSGGGTVNLDSWGSSISVTPPPNALDLSGIGG